MIGIYPILLIVLLFYVGLAYAIYLTFRARLVLTLAKRPHQDPWPIFRTAWMGAFGWFLLVVLVSMIPVVGALAFIVGALYGAVKLVIDAFKGLFGSRLQKQYWKENPPPKYQFSMLDLYVGIFVYGCTLAVFAMPGPQRDLPDEAVLAVCLYFLMATGIGFYVALDVLRRTKHLKSYLYRALFIGALTAYSSLLFVFTWMSWRGWLYALWQRDQKPVYTNPYLKKLQLKTLQRRADFRSREAGPGPSPRARPVELTPEVPPPLPPLQPPPPLPPDGASPGATPSA